MVIENITDNSKEILSNLLTEIGKIGLWMQTLGLIVIFWIVLQIINLILNKKKKSLLIKIKKDLNRVEKKIDQLKRNRR